MIRKKIPFDVKHFGRIERGQYDLVTRDGRIAVIEEINPDAEYPITASVFKQYRDVPTKVKYQINGRNETSTILFRPTDLFILTDEWISEFEVRLKEIINGYGSEDGYLADDTVKKLANELLEIAKKEINQQFPIGNTFGERSFHSTICALLLFIL